MNQEMRDQEWQQLQFRIDQMFGKFLKDKSPAIEYKPGNIALLLPLPDYDDENAEKMA
jgi:hypothetical protein